VALLGRSHRGSPEVEDTHKMISHDVEISIAGGGADEKDGEREGSFLFYFIFYIMYSLLSTRNSMER